MTSKIYAIDFDGVLCKCAYPCIGKPKKFNIWRVKRLKKKGHLTILWTCRMGRYLDEALFWCKEQGLRFDAVNDNVWQRTLLYGNNSRKVSADVYIDDKAKRWS